MPVFLKFIDMENFKSYRGRHRVGPLEAFTAIVGEYGSGISDFKEAVSFVMVQNMSFLGVNRLSDLIHGASINMPASRSASVTATIILKDMTEKQFQRSVVGDLSEYQINGQSVSVSQYLAELEMMGINVEPQNFLVSSVTVESVALQRPKELTAFFEYMSGSGALQEQYEACRAELDRAHEEVQLSSHTKKRVQDLFLRATYEKNEAIKYTRLKEELQQQKIELLLFHLYYIEKDIQNTKEELWQKEAGLAKAKRKMQEAEDALKEKKKEAGTVQRELVRIEQEIREVEAEISKKRPTFIKTKECVKHTQKKLEGAIKRLEQARKAHEAHEANIRKLEEELRQLEEQKAQWESSIPGSSSGSRADVHLKEAQINEYENLNMQVSRQSARDLKKLDSVNREQEADQDRLVNKMRRKGELENSHRQKGRARDEAIQRVDKLCEHIRSSMQALQALQEQNQVRANYKKDVVSCRADVAALQKALEEVTAQLEDARLDEHEVARREMKQEIVEILKREIPGVYDRMINMCQPTHKRYNVAVTKVMGNYMESIVVDTEKTARRCIGLLKQRMLEPETFLPLDNIQPKPLKKKLRDIKEPKNVKLLFAVLRFHPPAIHRAVLFVTNNVLVCETPEDASRVAYDLNPTNNSRYDAVALDGTFYQKSGIFSVGSLDLARKAKRWDERQLSQLKAEKEKLTEELRESMKKSRMESELTTADAQIHGLNLRLKYVLNDRETMLKQIETLGAEMSELKRGMDMFGPQIEEIERIIRSRDAEKQNVNNGVASLRQCGERELRAQQERAKKRIEFEAQINRIACNLEFEGSLNTQENVTRWERTVQKEEEELEASRQAEAEQGQDIDRELQRAEALKADRNAARAALQKVDDAVTAARMEVASVQKEFQSIQKQIASIETGIESQRRKRLNMLRQCQIEDIAIPLLEGNVDDLVEASVDDTAESESELASWSDAELHRRDSWIRVDYRSLSESLKELHEPGEIERKADELQNAVNSLENRMNKKAPNMRAMQNFNELNEKFDAKRKALVAALDRARKASLAFEKVKKERHDKFVSLFEHVSNEIDAVYKALEMDQSAKAFLEPENEEEPYLDGVTYYCQLPGMHFRPISYLSMAEKTVAVLALLFAIHSYQPAPLCLLDEIDVALDDTGIGKLASFIRSQEGSLQTLIISHKKDLYACAEALVGTSYEPEEWDQERAGGSGLEAQPD